MQTGRAFLFSLISLIEKGKQCKKQTTRGSQRADYPQENHNDFISCHLHHLPSYVFRQAGSLAREATTPVMGSMSPILTHFDRNFNYIHFRVGKVRPHHFQHHINITEQKERLENAGFTHFPTKMSVIQTRQSLTHFV